jgi:hypothetical protein
MEWLAFVAGLVILAALVLTVRWAARKADENIYEKTTPPVADDPGALASIADRINGGGSV